MTINPVLGKTPQQIYLFLFFLSDKILKGFDDGLVTGMILIDLRLSFDTMSQDILLKKLIIIGFSDHTVKWFQSYLSSCTFLVNLENYFSAFYAVCHKYQFLVLYYS